MQWCAFVARALRIPSPRSRSPQRRQPPLRGLLDLARHLLEVGIGPDAGVDAHGRQSLNDAVEFIWRWRRQSRRR